MRVAVAFGVLCALLMVTGGTAFAQAPAGGAGWRSYLQTPPPGLQEPTGVAGTAGAVANPEALAGGEGTTTLSFVAGGEPPVILLDFGKEIGGFPVFEVSALTGEPTLRASYSETLKGLDADGDYAGRSRLTRVKDHRIRKAGGFRSRQIEGGQRYMRLELSVPGTVSLSSAGIRFTGFRATPRTLRGHFLSSDDLLNRIWYAGLYTLNLNMIRPGFRQGPGQVADRGVIIDGAKRDRRVWSGDLLTAGPTAHYTVDPKYVKNSIARIGASPATEAVNRAAATGDIDEPGPLPGVCSPHTRGGTPCRFWSAAYSMAFVVALADYYRYTGDLGFVRRQWAAVERQMAWNARQVSGTTGLFVVDEQTGETWNLETFGGELTYVNSVYVMALRDAAFLAEAAGREGAKKYRARAANVTEAVNSQLWDEELGVYDLSTTYALSVVQDANVFAVLSGIAPPDRAARALNTLRRRLLTPYGALNVSRPFEQSFRPIISPYIGGLQVRAHFDTGQTPAALELIRSEWGWMLENDPGGTAWEKIRPDGRLSPFSSAAHAWSTGATSALSRYVLGASPVTPGWATWKVMPHPDDLEWARGEAPTSAGPLRVRWERRRSPGAFELRVRAPAGTEGAVWVPLYGEDHAVMVDGEVVWDGESDVRRDGIDVRPADDHLVVKAQTGAHRYSWTTRQDRRQERRRRREDARDKRDGRA